MLRFLPPQVSVQPLSELELDSDLELDLDTLEPYDEGNHADEQVKYMRDGSAATSKSGSSAKTNRSEVILSADRTSIQSADTLAMVRQRTRTRTRTRKHSWYLVACRLGEALLALISTCHVFLFFFGERPSAPAQHTMRNTQHATRTLAGGEGEGHCGARAGQQPVRVCDQQRREYCCPTLACGACVRPLCLMAVACAAHLAPPAVPK